MRNMLLGGLMLVLPIAASAEQMLKERKDWRYCSQDAQCILIDGACGKTAINALAKNDAMQFYAQKAKNVKCVIPFWKPKDAEMVARCRLGGCESIIKQPSSAAVQN